MTCSPQCTNSKQLGCSRDTGACAVDTQGKDWKCQDLLQQARQRRKSGAPHRSTQASGEAVLECKLLSTFKRLGLGNLQLKSSGSACWLVDIAL